MSVKILNEDFSEICKATYRFGYNGQEKDDEVKGQGNSLTFQYRIYDPRLGRFLSVDPLTKTFPWYSPYHFAGNSPIVNIDLEGAEPHPYYLLPRWAQSIYDAGHWMEQKVSNANSVASSTLNTYKTITGQEPSLIQKASAYTYGYLKSGFGDFSDANDAAVLTQGQNFDGSKATTSDYIYAGVGMAIPFGSGKVLKETIGKLSGQGKEILQSFAEKFLNYAGSLDEKHVKAAVNDILGSPVTINGKTYNHLQEVEEHLSGLGNQLSKLNKQIDNGVFSGDALDHAKSLRSNIQKEKDKITDTLNAAKKEASSKE